MSSKQKTVLLLDGDVFAFQAAAGSEYVATFGETRHVMADMAQAQQRLVGTVKSLKKELHADHAVNCLSCPTRHYWRHDVLPTYKGNRRDKFRQTGPISLAELKRWSAEQFDTECWDDMEADDVLGVLATDPDYMPGWRKIVVSIDKDMKTLPDTWQYDPSSDYQPWKQGREDADLWFLAQAIGGDSTDGYSGCRGVSTSGALEFLKDPWRWEQYEHVFKSGKRKGQAEMRWRKAEPSPSMWVNILSLYAKAGQTGEDALTNARVARICRVGDYDCIGGVRLWTPEVTPMTKGESNG